jgi:glutamate---cysteine ligase / carboxylate-amine ligase
MDDPTFTLGIEEEYILVDLQTFEPANVPADMLDACKTLLGDRVSPEFKTCQIEVGTGICPTIADARTELIELRSGIRDIAADHGLTPIATSCHPFADWKQIGQSDGDRYTDLADAMGHVARRMVTCGCHVHVGIGDDDLRIDLMNQFAYFLPHLLALSGSSPFWEGTDTGLASYRLSVFDNMPRTGLPPKFSDWSEYQRSVDVLIQTGIIEDASKIWWDLRPSSKFPTLEARICDVMPWMEDTLALAAACQALLRMLWRLKTRNQRWRIYDRFLVGENRWRAQRYGTGGTLIDLGQRALLPIADAVDELIDLTGDDASALVSGPELAHLRDIVSGGSSADRQRAVYRASIAAGADDDEALKAVVGGLIAEFSQGL